jgi:hypothetical protein
MPFKPHPIQVQALRIGRRFQCGFRPTKIAGKPVPPASVLSAIKFDSVPAFALSAEIGHLPGGDGLIDELCQRGYLARSDGYPKCPSPPLEYVTEDGTRVHVHDENWCEIKVFPPNAKHFQHHIGGFEGRLTLPMALPVGAIVKPSKPIGKAPKVKRRGGSARQGTCYELLPEGFKLLDEVEGQCEDDTLTGGEAATPIEGTTSELAERLCCSDQTIRNYAKKPANSFSGYRIAKIRDGRYRATPQQPKKSVSKSPKAQKV